ncbi:MAG: hypothetical protein KF690_03775 [Bacteroidetes bacterium]|nr:hypothetical protein [Bacteroidota bacterium]
MRATLLFWLVLLGAVTLRAENSVQIGTFLVEVVEDKIVCSWSARVEPTEGHYYVQKSADGRSWETICRLAAKGPKEPNPYYTFTHPANRLFVHYRLIFRATGGAPALLASEQVNYYVNFRLQEVEVQRDKQQLHLEYFLDKDKQLILRLYDQIGQQVQTVHLPSGRAGIYDYDLPLVGMSKGSYLVVITQEDFNLNVADFRVSY